FQNDAERKLHPFGICSTSHIKEVRRLISGILDQIHGSHRKSGTVNHTSYRSIEVNVVEACGFCFDFNRVFLTDIAHLSIFWLTEQRVVVEIHLRINSNNAVVRCFQHRVDLKHRCIRSQISIVQSGDELHHFLESGTAQPKVERNSTSLESLKPDSRIDLFCEYQMRSLLSYFLDVHSTFSRIHDHVAAFTAIKQYRHVKLSCFALSRIVNIFRNQNFVNFLSFRRRLRRDKLHSDNLLGQLLNLLKVL